MQKKKELAHRNKFVEEIVSLKKFSLNVHMYVKMIYDFNKLFVALWIHDFQRTLLIECDKANKKY